MRSRKGLEVSIARLPPILTMKPKYTTVAVQATSITVSCFFSKFLLFTHCLEQLVGFIQVAGVRSDHAKTCVWEGKREQLLDISGGKLHCSSRPGEQRWDYVS